MLSKQFVKAKIEEKNGLFITTLTYSWYGIYHFQEVNVFNTIEEAERYMLHERCQGLISYKLKDEIKEHLLKSSIEENLENKENDKK